ncbi:unnamed protein product [Prunus brigantina]
MKEEAALPLVLNKHTAKLLTNYTNLDVGDEIWRWDLDDDDDDDGDNRKGGCGLWWVVVELRRGGWGGVEGGCDGMVCVFRRFNREIVELRLHQTYDFCTKS